MNKTDLPLLGNKSFARRIGKSLSKSQKDILENSLPLFEVDINNPLGGLEVNREIYIEVGIGMAEHFINQAKSNPHNIYIGCEPYLNGVANCLKLAKEADISNYMLFPDDANILLSKLPEQSITGFYILFPDPWKKNKQKKRRLINEEKIRQLYNILKKEGHLIFGSDVPDYAEEVLELAKSNSFIDNSMEGRSAHANYVKTKYHKKAEQEGRSAQFLILKKL